MARDSTVLPEPDSPTMPSVLPWSSVKRHALDRPQRAAAGGEGDVEVLDFEQRARRRRAHSLISVTSK